MRRGVPRKRPTTEEEKAELEAYIQRMAPVRYIEPIPQKEEPEPPILEKEVTPTEPKIPQSVIDAVDGLTETVKSFKLRKFMLTYPHHHIDKEALESWLRAKFEARNCGKIFFLRMAHETGDKTVPYNHTHVVVHLDCQIQDQSKGLRYLDCDLPGYGYPEGTFNKEGEDISGRAIHPHIYGAKSSRHFEQMKVYLAKEDPDNDDLRCSDTGLFQIIAACNSIGEVLAKIPANQWPAAIQAWDHIKEHVNAPDVIKPEIVTLEKLFNGKSFRPWQVELLKRLEKRVPPKRLITEEDIDPVVQAKTEKQQRRIYCVYNPGFSIGKSHFVLAVKALNARRYASLDGMGSDKDVICALKKEMKKGWHGSVLLIDIPFKAQDRIDYGTIEKLRNGAASSYKYDSECGKPWHMEHIVLLTNTMPDIFQTDPRRWCVYQIKDAHGSLGKPLTQDVVKAHLLEHGYVEDEHGVLNNGRYIHR